MKKTLLKEKAVVYADMAPYCHKFILARRTIISMT